MVSSPRSRSLSAVRDAPVAPGSPPVVVEDVNDDLKGCRVSAHPDAAEVAGLGPSAAAPSSKTKARVSLGSAFNASATPAAHARGFTPPSASSKSVSPTHVPGGFVPNVLEELLGAPLPRPAVGGGVGVGGFPAPPGGPNAASPHDAHSRISPGVTTPLSGPAAPPRRASFNAHAANAAVPPRHPDDFLAEFAERRRRESVDRDRLPTFLDELMSGGGVVPGTGVPGERERDAPRTPRGSIPDPPGAASSSPSAAASAAASPEEKAPKMGAEAPSPVHSEAPTVPSPAPSEAPLPAPLPAPSPAPPALASTSARRERDAALAELRSVTVRLEETRRAASLAADETTRARAEVDAAREAARRAESRAASAEAEASEARADAEAAREAARVAEELRADAEAATERASASAVEDGARAAAVAAAAADAADARVAAAAESAAADRRRAVADVESTAARNARRAAEESSKRVADADRRVAEAERAADAAREETTRARADAETAARARDDAEAVAAAARRDADEATERAKEARAEAEEARAEAEEARAEAKEARAEAKEAREDAASARGETESSRAFAREASRVSREIARAAADRVRELETNAGVGLDSPIAGDHHVALASHARAHVPSPSGSSPSTPSTPATLARHPPRTPLSRALDALLADSPSGSSAGDDDSPTVVGKYIATDAFARADRAEAEARAARSALAVAEAQVERAKGIMDGFERAANASKRREAEAGARADEARRLVADREAAVSAREAKARTDERAVARKIKTCVLVAAVAILLAAAAIFKIVVDAAARDADVEAHAARIAAAERAAEEERLAASRERGEATRRVAALEAATRDAERVAADADAARERLARRVAEAEARVAEMTANERDNDRHVVGTLEACVVGDGIAGDGIARDGIAETTFPGVFSAPNGPGGQARALPARGFALVLVAFVVVAAFRVIVGGIRRRTKAKKEDEDAKREALADAVREWRASAEQDGSPGFRREEDDDAKTLVEEDDVFEDAFPAAGDEPISHGDFDQRL